MQRVQRSSFFEFVRESWDAARESQNALVVFLLLFVAANSTDLLVPWALGYTINAFVTHGFTEHAYRLGAIGIMSYIGLRLLQALFHHTGRYIQSAVSFTARMNKLLDVFTRLMSRPLYWHTKHHSGENLSRLQRSARAVDSLVGTFAWQILEGFVRIILACLSLLVLDWAVGVVEKRLMKWQPKSGETEKL